MTQEERLRTGSNSARFSRGFSLPELMVSMAVMGIITLISLDQVVTINKLKKSIDHHIQVRGESKLINNYLLEEVRQAGGGVVRPQMAIWAEDNCLERDNLPNCNGSDRLTIALINRNFNTCRVLGTNGANELIFDATTDACCSDAIRRQNIVLSEGDQFGHFFIFANVYNPGAPGTCRVRVTPGQMYGLNNVQPPALFSDWVGADMVVTDVSTFYLDTTVGELYRFKDANNNRNFNEQERFLLSDQVKDLQVILGYDSYPQDGRVLNLASDQDEWLFNVNSVSENLGQGGLSQATFNDLRMIGLAIMSYTNVNSGGSGVAQVFNSPNRSVDNENIGLSQSRIYLRSSLIFNN